MSIVYEEGRIAIRALEMQMPLCLRSGGTMAL